jgi:enoyl-CoA hydratase
LNSVDARLHTEMAWLWTDIEQDKSVYAVVLTGSGRAFCAGGDLDWFKNMTPEALDKLFYEARLIIGSMLNVTKPIISAINGAATGLGDTLALLSDISYASENAVIADTHVLAGIGAGDGGGVIWPLLCGISRAKEYLMTGDKLTARDAEKIGLINHVVPENQLIVEAVSMAKRLAAGPRLAITATKIPINKIIMQRMNLILHCSLALEKECFHTDDHKEAINSFLEKRKPIFNK